MKLWLSQPSERTGKRQLVLDLSRREEHEVFDVLRRQVIRGRAPKRNVRRDGSVRYRFSREHLDRLMATFPYVELSPGLNRRMARAAQRAQGDIEVPELDLPDFHADLYDFQKIGVQAVLDGLKQNHSFFLNDEMGLGKTVMALATMVKLMPVPVLVVCPNSAKWVWERMIERFTDFESVTLDSTCQTKPQRTALIKQQADVTIVNVEALRGHPELKRIEYGLIVTDEYHRFKNPKAAQTKAWHQLDAADHLMMSGTPLLNRLEEIWSALHAAFPDRYPDYYLFERWLCLRSKAMFIPERDEAGQRVLCFNAAHTVANSQCTERHTRRGNSTTPAIVMRRIPGKVVGYKPENFKKLKVHLHDPLVSIRRRKDQVLDDLPEVVYSTLLVDLTREQRRLYQRIVDEMRLELESGEIRTLRQMIVKVTRAKQACFSPELYGGSVHSQKMDELKLVVRELNDSGRKALIGSQWARAARIIERELKEYNPAYVDGSVKGRQRQEQVDLFNEDENCGLYIGTLRANQEAITLSAASYVIFTDKDWSPFVNDQFIGRSAAGGLRGVDSDESTVNVVELFARDTIEEHIEEVLGEKRNIFNAFVEVDGGALREQITVADLAKLF